MKLEDSNNIGSGSWSSCYLQDNGTVILRSKDFVKKLMSKDGWPKHRMWPQLKCVSLQKGRKYPLYQMEKLQIVSKMTHTELVKALSKRQFRWYKVLEKINFINGSIESQKKKLSVRIPKEFHRELEQIFLAFDYIDSQGRKANFECQDFNLAVKGDKIILLDCFFPSGNTSLSGLSNPKVHEITKD